MSDHERGPYTPPSEPPLAFDPRRPERRRGGPPPVTLIVSAIVLIGLIGGVAFIYRHGARHAGPPGLVGEPVASIKSPAPPQTAADNSAASLTVYKTGGPAAEAANAAPTFVAPPEAPQPRLASSEPPPPPPAPPAAVSKSARAPSQPLTIAGLADAAVAKDAATRAQAAAAASDLGGGDTVQIGAFSSPALADKAWTAIAKLDPAAMAGKGKKVEAFTKEDGESLYRTYITGFSDRTMAEGFCAQLQADGKTCLVK